MTKRRENEKNKSIYVVISNLLFTFARNKDIKNLIIHSKIKCV